MHSQTSPAASATNEILHHVMTESHFSAAAYRYLKVQEYEGFNCEIIRKKKHKERMLVVRQHMRGL